MKCSFVYCFFVHFGVGKRQDEVSIGHRPTRTPSPSPTNGGRFFGLRAGQVVWLLVAMGAWAWMGGLLWAKVPPEWTLLGDRPGDRMLAEYFRLETKRLADACLTDISSLDQWKARRQAYHRQFRQMLGLDPLPPRTELQPVVTGQVEAEDIVVEKLYFQSMPGLYVTGNLYRPKEVREPLPAVLYVCGHGAVKKGDISYGNKCTYQHHGIWLAKHGYVCLTIDTLQLGEIEGIHHGTYRYGMWWWNSYGYTPAGVEAWNCVRALDYLQTRKEVDAKRIGVTGRSGGGAYSWWIAALDDRIQAAVPVAGITDLENHVVDGCVEGHCDCMYIVNTYRWDYPLVAALIAPRPLLVGNTDQDSIFPLDGVERLFEKVRRIYRLYGAEDNFQKAIFPGGHQDLPELQKAAFAFFDKHLKGIQRDPGEVGRKLFEPEQLKVFQQLPTDQINTTIQERFVRLAPPAAPPEPKQAWQTLVSQWMEGLWEYSFRAWPKDPPPLQLHSAWQAESAGLRATQYEFTSQEAIRLPLLVIEKSAGSPPPPGEQAKEALFLVLADQAQWESFVRRLPEELTHRLEPPASPPEPKSAPPKPTSVVQPPKPSLEPAPPKPTSASAPPQPKPESEPPKQTSEPQPPPTPPDIPKPKAEPEPKSSQPAVAKPMAESAGNPASKPSAAKATEQTPAPPEVPPEAWQEAFRALEGGQVVVVFAPRGVGPTAFNPSPRKQVQIRRRFMLLGQTLEGMQLWDLRRAIQAVRNLPELQQTRWRWMGRGDGAGMLVYAALVEPPPAEMLLYEPPASHRDGLPLLNVRRIWDMREALAVAACRTKVHLHTRHPEMAHLAKEVIDRLGLGGHRVEIVALPESAPKP